MILQSGFLSHPFHRNKFWTLLLEVGVVPHSIFIALFYAGQGLGEVCMFGGGFSLLFITTYMHGFDLSILQKLGFAALYVGFWVTVYAVGGREFSNMVELMRIGASFVFVPVGWIIWAVGCLLLAP